MERNAEENIVKNSDTEELENLTETYEAAEDSADQNSSTGLELNISVLNERGETYTSLSDLYSISVYTDRVMKTAAAFQEEKAEKEKQMQNSIFIYKESKDNKDEELTGKLFTASFHQSRKIDYVPEEDQNIFIYISAGVLLSVVFALLMVRYGNRRKRKRIEWNSENSYES